MIFDLILWRESLADAPVVPTAHDLRDWASVLEGAGERDAATLLGDVATILHGVPPVDPAPAAHGADWTVHRALAELRGLARDFAPSLTPPPRPTVSGRPDNAAGIGPAAPIAPPVGDVAHVARGLRAILADPTPDAAALDALAGLLSGLIEADRRLPALDYRRHADAALPQLVATIALCALCQFALATRDLATAPLGSPAFLHRVARLDAMALGPYLANVGALVRNSGDVFDLARVAADASEGRSGFAPWIVLLARGCRPWQRFEIIDDLGDSGDTAMLSALLDRVAASRAAAVEMDAMMRLRDAALDNADHALAARAQTLIATLRPHERIERTILGSILATGGDFGAAEALFREILLETPDDMDLRARLIAARDGDFAGLEVSRGYGSPADRAATRLRRRGMAPGYARRAGERITAVDVS